MWPDGWTLRVERLPSGWGRCRWVDRVIVVDPRLKPPQLRTTLAHEAVHARRGPCPGWARPREETIVHEQAGRWLIGPAALARELEWSPDPRVIAANLDVTPDLVDARLHGLDPAEYADLWARTEHHRQAGA